MDENGLLENIDQEIGAENVFYKKNKELKIAYT